MFKSRLSISSIIAAALGAASAGGYQGRNSNVPASRNRKQWINDRSDTIIQRMIAARKYNHEVYATNQLSRTGRVKGN